MRFAAANVRELIFLKIAIEQKAVEYGLKGRIVVASNVFVYTKTLFALQNACWGVPQTPLFCIFQCRLRIPMGHFLPGDVLRVVENLHEVRSSFCKRSVLHLFWDRRIQKRSAPFLHTFRKLLLRQLCSLPAHLR